MSTGITYGAAKFIYNLLVTEFNNGKDNTKKSIVDYVNNYDLWIADEWTHLGFCILVCLDNIKLINSYHNGNNKIIDILVGKTIKISGMTVEPKLIQELMPLVIKKYFIKMS